MADILQFPKYGNTGFPDDMMAKMIMYINKKFETDRLVGNYFSKNDPAKTDMAEQAGVPNTLIAAGLFEAAMDFLATQPGYKKTTLSETDYTLQRIK